MQHACLIGTSAYCHEICQSSSLRSENNITVESSDFSNIDAKNPFSTMSQGYFAGGSGSSAGEGSSRHAGEEERVGSPFYPRPPPAYMTVGNGSTSDSATALMSSLNNDSGYGGSIASGSAMDGDEGMGWHADLMEDRPTPGHTPTNPGEYNPAGLSHMFLCLRHNTIYEQAY